jgi:hypothetical protein
LLLKRQSTVEDKIAAVVLTKTSQFNATIGNVSIVPADVNNGSTDSAVLLH